MQAPLMNMANVVLPQEPFPVVPQTTTVPGETEGGFAEHLAQALAGLLARPGSSGLPEDGLPPALGALRRALEEAGAAVGASLEQALRPLLDKILTADGYSRPVRDRILELSQAEDSRIDLAALFELAAQACPVPAAAGAAGASPEDASWEVTPAVAPPTASFPEAAPPAEGAWERVLAELEAPEVSLPEPELEHAQGRPPRDVSEAPAGDAPKADPSLERPGGAQALGLEDAARGLPTARQAPIPAQSSQTAGRGGQAEDAPQAGPAPEKAQAAPRPEQAAINAAGGRTEDSPPGLEVARTIQEILSATLSRAAPEQRRGRVHVEARVSQVGPESPGDETPEAARQVQPALGTEGRALGASTEPTPGALLGQPPADAKAAGQPAPSNIDGRRRQPAGVDSPEARLGFSDRPAEPASEVFRPAPTPELVRQVAHQVERAITAGLVRGEDRLRIRLKPPELGELRLDLSLRGEDLKVILVAESSAAKDALQAAVADLRGSLAEQGLRLEQFMVFIRHEGGNPDAFLGRDQAPPDVVPAQASPESPAIPEGLAAPSTGRVDIFC